MLSIIKQFFVIKTNDPNLLPVKIPFFGDKTYKFKFKHEDKRTAWCFYFCSCFGMVPAATKDHRKYHKAIEKAEERLKRSVNARVMMGILDDHH